MEDVTRKRGAVKSKLTTFKKYVTSLINKTDNGEVLSEVELSMLEERLSRTENLIHKFDKIQLQIELTAADPDKEYKEREEFEHAICNIEPVGKESASKFRKLVDTVSKNLRALDQLEQPTSQWDTLLVYIISTKLDAATAREWEVSTFENLKSFLKSKADMLETLEIKYSDRRPAKPQLSSRGFLSSNVSCSNCKKEHPTVVNLPNSM
ncbi:hypothetical protein CBL_08614 [Carabus blaptoides fortunei]